MIGKTFDSAAYFEGQLDYVKIWDDGVLEADWSPIEYGNLEDQAGYTVTNNGVTFVQTGTAPSVDSYKYDIELESERDGYKSFTKYNTTVDVAGYGLNYGKHYGGSE